MFGGMGRAVSVVSKGSGVVARENGGSSCEGGPWKRLRVAWFCVDGRV